MKSTVSSVRTALLFLCFVICFSLFGCADPSVNKSGDDARNSETHQKYDTVIIDIALSTSAKYLDYTKVNSPWKNDGGDTGKNADKGTPKAEVTVKIGENEYTGVYTQSHVGREARIDDEYSFTSDGDKCTFTVGRDNGKLHVFDNSDRYLREKESERTENYDEYILSCAKDLVKSFAGDYEKYTITTSDVPDSPGSEMITFEKEICGFPSDDKLIFTFSPAGSLVWMSIGDIGAYDTKDTKSTDKDRIIESAFEAAKKTLRSDCTLTDIRLEDHSVRITPDGVLCAVCDVVFEFDCSSDNSHNAFMVKTLTYLE